jgi:protein SCO1
MSVSRTLFLRSRGILTSLALAGALWLAGGGAADANRWGKDYLPNVPVQTQDGRTLSFYDDVVRDKIVVINFIFTTCRDICPLLTARLAQVRQDLDDIAGKRVHFISITVDPETDTPPLLKAHADAFGAPADWLFLTGKPEHIKLIRHKLGERSRVRSEHRMDVLLGNLVTGEWQRDSMMSDLSLLGHNIRSMDPVFRATPQSVPAQGGTRIVSSDELLPGQALFAKACASCHTVGGGDRVGPDLLGVTKKRERAWLETMMTTPKVLHAQGDPIALELAQRFKAVRMPTLGLSKSDAADLATYLATQTYNIEHPPTKPHDHSAHAGRGPTPPAAGRSAATKPNANAQ